ncbi:uncharacterized protein LOC127132012 [Lathyrus oleraceus]|uniref:uncharacterized protein LOC127132012 n=1 Tax=Pisum sativum TaxID=3888 RepID=UPI0021D1FC85|nr:uncharacterized protein LOC127132012 [Pisum sativum]
MAVSKATCSAAQLKVVVVFKVVIILRLLLFEGRTFKSLQKDGIEERKVVALLTFLYVGRQRHNDSPLRIHRVDGVHRIIVTGGSLQESREALAIAETDGRLFCTVGVHPTRCKEFEESGDPENHFQALLSLAKEGIQKGKVVAVGECGLDYDRLHFCPAEIQKKYFEKQFELAYITKLPMFLHMRAAAEDFCEIVEKNKDRFSGGVTHSFTGTTDECVKLLSFDKMHKWVLSEGK